MKKSKFHLHLRSVVSTLFFCTPGIFHNLSNNLGDAYKFISSIITSHLCFHPSSFLPPYIIPLGNNSMGFDHSQSVYIQRIKYICNLAELCIKKTGHVNITYDDTYIHMGGG